MIRLSTRTLLIVKGSGRKHKINRKLKFKDHSISGLEDYFNSKEYVDYLFICYCRQ